MTTPQVAMNLPRSPRKQLKSLESLRGIAALMIVFYHLSELLKVPLPNALDFISNKFWLGVPLFYSLSGFVIAYGYAERVGNADQRLKFYIARFFRIAPLFYTMLAVMTLWTWGGHGQIIDFQTMILNVTFLFGLVPGKHESVVMAGWSIGIEMLFYILFPLFAATIKTIRGVVIAFIIACCLSALVRWQMGQTFGSYAYMNLLTHLPFFMAGIGGYRIWQLNEFSQNRVGWLLLGSSLLLSLVIASNIIPALDSLLGLIYLDFWALILGTLILSVCMVSVTPLEHPMLRRCGELSFSLYLLHPMLMVTLNKLQLVGWLSARFANEWLVFTSASLITISLLWGLSNITYRLVEVPGIALGRRLARACEIPAV
jgi:peptidoglycan/LPS O-acetylase OafA/YrhL